MTIERTLYFANGVAYHLQATASRMNLLFENCDDEEYLLIHNIIKRLQDIAFTSERVDFIPDPFSGVLTVTEQWFADHGVEVDEDDDEITLGTFDVTLESDDDMDEDECIESDEEVELCIGAHVLAQLNRGLFPVLEVDESSETDSEYSV